MIFSSHAWPFFIECMYIITRNFDCQVFALIGCTSPKKLAEHKVPGFHGEKTKHTTTKFRFSCNHT